MATNLLPAPEILPLSYNASTSNIDTNTLISIQHQRHDVDLYYTLDGSKPDTFNSLSTRKSTFLYKNPFYIHTQSASSGKVLIRAAAVTQDGIHESMATSRIFLVRIVPPDHPTPLAVNENKYLQELCQERETLMLRVQEQNRWIDQKRARTALEIQNYDQVFPEFPSENIDPRNPREILRCAHCYVEKSDDPYTRYCSNCGRPWQKLNFRPTKTSLIRTCPNCDTIIPFQNDACVVCETPASSQRIRSATSTTIVCRECKMSNSPTEKNCHSCNSKLLPTTFPTNRACVSVETNDEQDAICSVCQHKNELDARFCYWCGTRRTPRPLTFPCNECKTQNQWTSKFCLSCGCVLEKPLHIVDENSAQQYDFIPRSSLLIRKPDAATQTSGIQYPSSKQLDVVIEQNRRLLEEKEIQQQQQQQHQPRLRPKSPGQGYWKKQIDHVYAHLYDYATKRDDFKSSIGSPTMGELSSATIDETNDEIRIATVFRKAGQNPRNVRFGQRNEHRVPYSYGFERENEFPRQKRKPEVKQPRSASPRRRSDERVDSLMEILENRADQKHQLSTRQVERCIKNGENLNAQNSSGYTLLQLAVINGHHYILETLAKSGAKPEKRGGPKKDTALHQCCRLRDEGVEPLRTLLRFCGDHLLTNGNGDSVLDLASKKSQALVEVIQQNKQRMESKGDRAVNSRHKS